MYKLTSLLLALCASQAALAERLPAGMIEGDKALLQQLGFPDIKGDFERAIVCAGIVKTNGKMDGGGCYVIQPGDEVYAGAVSQALKKARWTPASIDGKKVEIYFQYRVLFVQKGEDRKVGLLPNPGHAENVEAYGPQHVAAQRVLTGEAWQKVCPNYAQFSVLAKAHVSFEGVPSSISVSEGAGLPITDNCRRAITDTLNQSLYIPAMVDGEAVPSTYTEPFGN
ncbi:MAG: hypothetical protein OEW35_04475 [Gammaproteobacteria bacterium]|nr:hypothetical protein [Gammaproteobacteria bacterium]MDH4254036.1 hypothetical protein [Gammaproteobacteria bacterium]MDH5310335.1 hypothetical protein [Gammaproteobacteria bacterium]